MRKIRLGIDYEGRDDPDFFKTWNGEKTVYILDEQQAMMGKSAWCKNLTLAFLPHGRKS